MKYYLALNTTVSLLTGTSKNEYILPVLKVMLAHDLSTWRNVFFHKELLSQFWMPPTLAARWVALRQDIFRNCTSLVKLPPWSTFPSLVKYCAFLGGRWPLLRCCFVFLSMLFKYPLLLWCAAVYDYHNLASELWCKYFFKENIYFLCAFFSWGKETAKIKPPKWPQELASSCGIIVRCTGYFSYGFDSENLYPVSMAFRTRHIWSAPVWRWII